MVDSRKERLILLVLTTTSFWIILANKNKILLKIGTINMLTQLHHLRSVFLIAFIGLFLPSCGSSTNTNQATTTPASTIVNEETTLALPSVNQTTLTDDILAINAVAEMGIGINLGNTLDAPNEGDWALAAEEYYIQAFKDAGFQHVRIPVTWNSHVALEAPYQINEDFLNRVEQIVDWSLDRDLYVILNVHHDDWLKKDFDSVSNRNRFDSIWLQVSDRFKDKSAKLMFEILNEPQDLTIEQLNNLNKRALTIIRNQTANRLVVFAGTEYSNVDALLAIEVPDSNDEYLIGNFHSYDPWQFAGMCLNDWSTDNDKQALKDIYQKAFDWSSTNNIPVMVNEFGVAKYDFENPENVCEQSQRENYIRSHVNFAKEFGISATFWDDGGSFSTYNRSENAWGAEKDILVGN